MSRATFSAAGALLALCALLPLCLGPAQAQDQPPAEQEKKQPTQEQVDTLAQSLGQGLAIACYSSLQHLGGLADEVTAGKAPSSVLVKANVVFKMLEGFEKQIKDTKKKLDEGDDAEFDGLIALIGQCKDAASALTEFAKTPNNETATAFTTNQRLAWASLCKAFKFNERVSELTRPGGFDLQAPGK